MKYKLKQQVAIVDTVMPEFFTYRTGIVRAINSDKNGYDLLVDDKLMLSVPEHELCLYEPSTESLESFAESNVNHLKNYLHALLKHFNLDKYAGSANELFSKPDRIKLFSNPCRIVLPEIGVFIDPTLGSKRDDTRVCEIPCWSISAYENGKSEKENLEQNNRLFTLGIENDNFQAACVVTNWIFKLEMNSLRDI